jgi:hypothetical protein
MSETDLSTTRAMFANASDELDRARTAAEQARAWLQSDARPVGVELTPDEARARVEALKMCRQIKDMAERAEDSIGQVVDG